MGENLELQRDLISRALFEAGFDQPMIWAGRKLLEAENQSSIVNRLLPSRALGAGPSAVPGIATPLYVQPNQLEAIARRGSLAPPSERPLRVSVVMPVYNEKKTFRDVMEALLAKTMPGFRSKSVWLKVIPPTELARTSSFTRNTRECVSIWRISRQAKGMLFGRVSNLLQATLL